MSENVKIQIKIFIHILTSYLSTHLLVKFNGHISDISMTSLNSSITISHIHSKIHKIWTKNC